MADELNHYDSVIADLRAKRDHLSFMIDALEQLKALGISPTQALATFQQTAKPSAIAKDAFFGMTIPDAAKKYLNLVKATKSNPELCDALLAGGFKTTSEHFTEVVRSTLGRNKEFVKINGEWGLQEWYGSRQRRMRARTLDAAPPEQSFPSSELMTVAEADEETRGGQN